MLAADVVQEVEQIIQELLLIGKCIDDRKKDLKRSGLSEDEKRALEVIIEDSIETAKRTRSRLIFLFPDQKAPARNFLFKNKFGAFYGVKLTAAKKPSVSIVEDVNVEIIHYDNIE